MRIVSGGQTGADRGGLDAALALGLQHGGWCPLGRRAEDGRIPDRYELRETKTRAYAERTRLNVRDADGTVVFSRGPLRGGSALTAREAKRLGKPLLHLDLVATEDPVSSLARWLERERVSVLNVAGMRESRAPGIAAEVREILVAALS